MRWTTKAEARNCTLGLQALINSRAAAQFPRLSAVSVRKPYGLCLTFLAGGYGDCTAALKSHENRTVSSQLPYGFVPTDLFLHTHPSPLPPPPPPLLTAPKIQKKSLTHLSYSARGKCTRKPGIRSMS